jgi:hypothetical protein
VKILYVVDGRSPIAVNWIEFFIEAGHEVHLVSTFDLIPNLNLKSFEFVPVAFSQVKGKASSNGDNDQPSGIFWKRSAEWNLLELFPCKYQDIRKTDSCSINHFYCF